MMAYVPSVRSHYAAIVSTILGCYLYCFMEWLFFSSQASMFSYLSIEQQLGILFNAPVPIMLVLLPMVIMMVLLARLCDRFGFGQPQHRISLSLIVPAVLLGSMAFLMLDNFSYTLFGIASTSHAGLAPRSYYLGMLVLLPLFFLNKLRLANRSNGVLTRHPRLFTMLAFMLPLLSSVSLALSYHPPLNTELTIPAPLAPTTLPNILILGADGVNSANMSLYGYERKTTPFLDSIADESLVFRYHWTNSAKTTGAMGALLSGKYPTRTRVIFRPDAFTGSDMFQHLPGILRKFGYYNIDICLRHYADPEDLKLRKAFDYANHRELNEIELLPTIAFLLRWPDTMQFIEESWERLYQRLAHVSGLRLMVNPFQQVTQGANIPEDYSDVDRIHQLKQQIQHAPRPFFANVHLMGPHGSKFDYQIPIFTQDKRQSEFWMPDHYDNAIHQWDAYAAEVYALFEELGELDNTLLIFNSDHGQRHRIHETQPLIMRFPGKRITGNLEQASQRLDIAPTILAYLGVTPPAWMDGQSLLSRGEQPYPIFIVGSKSLQTLQAGEWKMSAQVTPPFYTLGTMSMAYCGMLYSINLNVLEQPKLTYQRVHPRTRYCPEGNLELKVAASMIITHLHDMGYDTFKLTAWLQRDSLFKQ